MNQDAFGALKEKLNDLALRYSLQLRVDELNAYYSGLARFPLSISLGALNAVPEAFPTAFPSVDQIIEMCDDLAAKEGSESATVTLLRAVDECPHEYEFEPEPEGSLYDGFDVCKLCGRARPRVNKAAPPIQLEYFRMAVNPEGRQS